MPNRFTDPAPVGIRATAQGACLRLSELTTIGLGGPARRLIEAVSDDQVIDAVAAADAAGEPLLVIAGGSNVVIADDGFEGTVVRILTQGVAADNDGDRVRLCVAAGQTWDGLVERAVAADLTGIECLSGIPGSAGATPIQNVGAYGQEVAQTIVGVRAYDRRDRIVRDLSNRDCNFAYRSSRFRRSDRHVVLGMTYELERSSLARPVRYAGLAAALGVELGARPPLPAVREAVLSLRRQKGMVVDRDDPDSVSVGSFFVNPVMPAERFAALERRVAHRVGEAVRAPAWALIDGRVKTSAAWLIERSGFPRGYRKGRAGISEKHTLALINRGGATTAELIALAREIRDGVRGAFGVTLQTEPVLVGVEL